MKILKSLTRLTMPIIGLVLIGSLIMGGIQNWDTLGIGDAHADSHTDSAKEQLEKSPRHGEWVKVSTESGREVSAFIVFPEVKENATSVIVIHEIFGLTDWIRQVGDELAKAGFVAICPDFLSGMGPNGGGTDSFGGDNVRRAIRDLAPDQITADLKAVTKYVRDLPATTDTVAVSGFCWGGAQSFRFATNDDSLKAAFVFYGSPPDAAALGKITCPVYGFYGENDNRINSTIESTKEAAKSADVTYEPVIYSGVGHGFLRRGMAADASEAQKTVTSEAWERWVNLLNKH